MPLPDTAMNKVQFSPGGKEGEDMSVLSEGPTVKTRRNLVAGDAHGRSHKAAIP